MESNPAMHALADHLMHIARHERTVRAKLISYR